MNEANLDNVTHEEAVAALKATQEVVNLTIAKPSYIPDNVSQDQGTPPCKSLYSPPYHVSFFTPCKGLLSPYSLTL